MAGATAYIPAALTLAGSVLGYSGANKAAAGAQLAGQRTAGARAFEAKQLRQNAGQEIAASQRAAQEERRQAGLVASRQIALAAASGAGASDPTIVQMIARTAREGSYRASVALYGGEERARQLRMAAAGKDYEGAAAIEGAEVQASAYKTAGVGELLKGGGSLFAKYGFGGPTAAGGNVVLTSGGLDTSWLDAGTEAMRGIG